MVMQFLFCVCLVLCESEGTAEADRAGEAGTAHVHPNQTQPHSSRITTAIPAKGLEAAAVHGKRLKTKSKNIALIVVQGDN
jgi:hypothetical protein